MVLDNIKNSAKHLYERFNSPFGGTFITVWVIHHWQLVYSFFTFDDDCTLNDRIYILQQYLDKSNTCELFWWPLLYTFIVIILYLVFSNIGYAAIVAAEKWAKPIIYYFIDRNKNAPREYLDKMKIRTRGLQIDLQKLEDIVQETEGENKELKSKLSSTETEVYNLREIQKEQTFKVADLEQKLKKNTENFKAELSNEILNIRKSMTSKIHANEIDKANSVLDGVWELSYKTIIGETGQETFFIDKENRYIVNEKVEFIITGMLSIENGKFIVFTKHRDGNPDVNLVNRLLRTYNGNYIGFEDNLINVEYTRLKSKRKKI